MNFNTNKEIGVAGLSLAIAYFGSNGYVVSVPLNDTQDYDIIVDNGTLYKVQIKATSQLTEHGSYCVDLRSKGGTKGVVYKTLIETEVDYLFVLCADKTMYLIPKTSINSISSIKINKIKGDYVKYIVSI